MNKEVESSQSSSAGSKLQLSTASCLAYNKLFANYKQIYEYNKSSLQFFHTTYYNMFNNILSNPADILKTEIQKKISSYFKVYDLNEYFAFIGSFDESKSEYPGNEKNINEEIKNFEKLEKMDISLIFKIFMKIIMVMISYFKKLKKDLFQNPMQKTNDLLQIFPFFTALKQSAETQKLFENILVIELVEISEVTCVIIPSEVSPNSFEEMIPTLRSMEVGIYQIYENPSQNIPMFIPIEILELLKKINLESEEMLDVENMIPNLMEIYFTEKNMETKKVFWRIDRLFLFEYYAVIQISKMLDFMLKANKIELKKCKNFYEEIIKGKQTLASQIMPNSSKDTYKQVFKLTNYNYLLALSWISEEKFPNTLIFNEFLPNEKDILNDSINFLNPNDEKTPLSLLYIFLYRLQSKIDECELSSKFMSLKAMQYEANFENFLAKQKNQEFDKTLSDFITNQLSEILRLDNDDSLKNDQLSNDKDKGVTSVYSINVKKIALKYESSLSKESLMDVKEYQLNFEVNRNGSLIVFKMKLPEFQMSIENGDELLYFDQVICSKFAEMTLDIDETRRIVLRSMLYFNFENFVFARILEIIDFLIIASHTFNIVGIRSIFYYKPSKDSEKYEMFVNLMRENIKVYKKTMKLFPGWRRIRKTFNYLSK